MLDPMPASNDPQILRVSGQSTEVIRDVVVGEVWLCSGQSNMELPVSRTLNAPTEIASADNPRIRMLKVGQRESALPRHTFELPVRWRRCV